MEIEGIADGVRLGVALQVEMGDLAQCMDARIGAPGAEKRYLLAREFPDRVFKRLLHAEAVILALPADEVAAMEFDDDLVTRHGRFFY